MTTITDNDLALFRARAKTELKSTGDIGRLAWDDVVEALCAEVARLRSVSSEGGNCAKLREVCQKMRDLLMLRGDGKARCILTWDEFNESQKMLRAAVATTSSQTT